MKTESQNLRKQMRNFSQKGQLDLAIKSAQQILKDEPNDVRMMLSLGDLYFRRGEFPSSFRTYLQAADFYTEQGSYFKALAIYKEVIRLDTTSDGCMGPAAIEAKKKLPPIYKQIGLDSDAVAIEKELQQLLTKQENSS